MKTKPARLLHSLLALGALPAAAHAQVSYVNPGSTYSQDFDTATFRANEAQAWADNGTFTGWYAASYNNNTTTFATPGTFWASNGVSGTASIFTWYRAVNSLDNALGSQPTDTANPGINGSSGAYYGVQIRNSTSATLTSFTLGFDVEHWRQASGTAPTQTTLTASYRLTAPDASFGVLDGWTGIPDSTYTTVLGGNGGTAATSINGNANSVTFSGLTVSDVALLPGDSLWIRWFDVNNSGADHGIGLDNFTFSAIPEPSAFASLAGLAALGFAALGRRRR